MSKGIILSALGGASDVLLNDIKRREDNEEYDRRAARANAMDVEKSRTLALLSQQLKEAPLIRLQDRAKALANETVPLESTPVTGLTGTYASDAGPSNSGFQGDIKSIQAAIDKLPDGPDKQAALAQLREQVDDAQAAKDQGIVGRVRNRTSEEAFEAAMAEAKSSDLAAYQAGKPLAAEKTVKVGEGETVIDQKTGKVIFDSAGKREAREAARQEAADRRQEVAEEGRDRRQAAMLAAQEKLAGIRAGTRDGGTSKEERLRYTSLFNEVGRRMSDVQKTINTLRRDPLYSMAKPGSAQAQELAELQSQLREYKTEREMYSQLLSGSQTDGGAASPSGPAPAPTQDRPPLSSFQRK